MALRSPFLILIAMTTLVTPVGATILYDADGSSTFELILDGGMTITATAGTELPSLTTSGTGIGAIDEDVQIGGGPLTPGSTLTQISEVSGSAAPPAGFSSATVLNGYLITLDNSLGTVAATATFSFTYDWSIEVTQTDPVEALREAGFASAFFHLTGFAPSGDETLKIDDGSGGGAVAVTDWLFHPGVAFDFTDTDSSGSSSGSITVTALVEVPAGHIEAFSVITDATGAAGHIPEPAILFTLGLGLLGIVGVRRQPGS